MNKVMLKTSLAHNIPSSWKTLKKIYPMPSWKSPRSTAQCADTKCITNSGLKKSWFRFALFIFHEMRIFIRIAWALVPSIVKPQQNKKESTKRQFNLASRSFGKNPEFYLRRDAHIQRISCLNGCYCSQTFRTTEQDPLIKSFVHCF